MRDKPLTVFHVLGIILIFAVAANLPFISQAFHIDDPLNIYLARHLLKNPGNPYNFSLVYFGVEKQFFKIYANPPLNGYFLSLAIRFFGENERALHLSYMVFAVLSGLAMFLISVRFLSDRKDAMLATVLLLISPAFFVMSHTIMPDIPFFCFYLLAVYFFLEAQERNKNLLYVISGISAAVTCLIRYSGLTLIPLFLFCLFLRRGKRNPGCAIAVLIPLLSCFLWCTWTMLLYSQGYWKDMLFFETKRTTAPKVAMHLLANISYLGGSAIFPLAFLCLLKGAGRKVSEKYIWIAASICLLLAALLHNSYDHSLGQCALFFVFGFSFILFLAFALGQVRAWLAVRSINLLLIFWILVLIGFNSLFLHTAVKYNLIVIAPVILIFVILLRTSYQKGYRRVLMMTIVATGILSSIVAMGDMKFANSYRVFAEKFNTMVDKQNNQVYYTGHWGWEYYMEKFGARPIMAGEEDAISKGDIIIVPSIAWPRRLAARLKERTSSTSELIVTVGFPVRTMNGWAKAFFYADHIYPNYRGVLPYSFTTRAPLEIFYLIEID